MTYDEPTLRVGVLGHGLRASLAAVLHARDDAEVVAVCDPDPATHEEIRSRYGRAVVIDSDPATLLRRDLDAVLVLTPDHLHEEHATRALGAGMAVYLEKPMATTTEACDRILAAARRTGGRLYLGHNMRHMPFVRMMKRLIDEGAIGEPRTAWCRHFVGHGGDFYFRDWHADRRNTTGLLLQKGAHDIDVLHWLMGSHTVEVTAMGALSVYGAGHSRATRPQPWRSDPDPLSSWPPAALHHPAPVVDVEDVSMMLMRLDNDTLCSYQQCHFTPDYWRNYTVIGTEGRLENFGDGGPGTVIRVWDRRYRGYAAGGSREVTVPAVEGGHGGSDERIVAEFCSFVRRGGAVETSPLAARDAVAAGCAATTSLRGGGDAVRVPPMDETTRRFFTSGPGGDRRR